MKSWEHGVIEVRGQTSMEVKKRIEEWINERRKPDGMHDIKGFISQAGPGPGSEAEGRGSAYDIHLFCVPGEKHPVKVSAQIAVWDDAATFVANVLKNRSVVILGSYKGKRTGLWYVSETTGGD